MKRDVHQRLRVSAVGLALLTWGSVVLGGEHPGTGAAPGPGRPEISGLGSEEVRGLQEGEGMGFARAAELNGYPGPTHVLEASREGKIHLDAEQRRAIEEIRASMKAEARALGQQILALEARLEAGFREKRMTETDLARGVEDIGRQRTALRLAHLRAHLLTARLLRPEQIEHYNQIRGYASQSPEQRHGH